MATAPALALASIVLMFVGTFPTALLLDKKSYRFAVGGICFLTAIGFASGGSYVLMVIWLLFGLLNVVLLSWCAKN